MADDPSSETNRPGIGGEARLQLRPHRLLAGQGEPIFAALPESVLQNLWNPTSETALLWNLLYPLTQAQLHLEELLRLRPIWGSAMGQVEPDSLTPYFWGFDLAGRAMPGLEQATDRVDGMAPQAEVDLYLLGARNLVLVEAKHLSGPGRCARYAAGRCPEIHRPWDDSCRYWEAGPAAFSAALDFGERPTPEAPAPPCSRHYQLGRLLLIGLQLAALLERKLHFWLLLPKARWGAIAADWLDFVGRVADRETWNCLRVISWEQIRWLAAR